MDSELVAFLDQRFGAISQQISSLRDETALRFERIELRFDRLEQRVDALEARLGALEGRFDKLGARLDGLETRFDGLEARFDGLEARFDGLEARVDGLDERSRQTLVLLEGIRHEVRLIAEGFVGLNDRVDRFQAEATLVFDQVKGWIEPYYKSLDGRLKVLEGQAERRHLSALEQVKLLLGRSTGPLEPTPASG